MPTSSLLNSSSGTTGGVVVTPSYNPTPMQLTGREDTGKNHGKEIY